MEFLKDIFGANSLNWESFSKAVQEKGYKLANLAEGNYVGKGKYTDDIAAKEAAITALQSQLSDRDKDLAELKQQLEKNSTTNKTTIADLTAKLEKMQSDYSAAKDKYSTDLKQKEYEFAVREFANEQMFSSNAAKRDFINELLKKNLSVENSKILGASDFVTAYKGDNPDAFQAENAQNQNKPTFATGAKQNPEKANPFSFNFTGVRLSNQQKGNNN